MCRNREAAARPSRPGRAPSVRVSIDGWNELRAEVGDIRAMEMLREFLARIPKVVERDMRTGGRVVTEWNMDTGEETIRVRGPEE